MSVVRFCLHANNLWFPTVDGSVYFYGERDGDELSKHLNRSGFVKRFGPKALEMASDLKTFIDRRIGSSVTDVFFFSGKVGGQSARNIFKVKPEPALKGVGKVTIMMLPVVSAKTKSIERIAIPSDSEMLAFASLTPSPEFVKLPCKICFRYTNCATSGKVGYDFFSTKKCPGFSRSEIVHPVVTDKAKLNAMASDEYARQVEVLYADTDVGG